ncbi:MAG: cysteine desulfurase NifS [Desulfobacteraceae bacterium]|nr:cysteine desulfurase NifS [Desulfobacteraceae bacterium]
MIDNPIYLDNNATTRTAPEVIEAMLPYLGTFYGNPSSMHSFGGQVADKIKEARQSIAKLFNASPDEFIFTSCGTESDSAAILSAIKAFPEKKHLITSSVEHPAVKNLYENLKKQGYKISLIPVDSKGRLDLDFYRENLTEDTAIVSLMWANNETGTIFPIKELAQLAKEKGVLFHTDAVQAAGKIATDLNDAKVDMLSLSGHKLHAPKGIGALYIRKGTPFYPFLVGGHQEGGKRAGTENTASIIALGKACELAMENMEKEQNEVKRLRDKLEKALLEKIPHSFVNGDIENRLPNTSSISFEYIEGEAILLMMDQFKICASSGSACTSGSLEPSHVLRSMGVPYEAAHGTVRFSLSIYTTEDEIDFVIEKMPSIIQRLREMSPFWKG